MKIGVKVSDAMTTSPVSVNSSMTIFDCSKTMLSNHVGSLLVLHNNHLEGIITEKDIVRIVAKGLDTKETSVGEVMTTRIHSTKPHIDLAEATHHMHKNKVRRLPVIHEDRVVGMLTMNDILAIQPALYEILIAKGNHSKMEKKKEKYMEGVCESCENFAQLHERDGKFICAECMEEQGEQPQEDS